MKIVRHLLQNLPVPTQSGRALDPSGIVVQYRYEARPVTLEVFEAAKIGGQYPEGEVVDGMAGMGNDLILIVAYPMQSKTVVHQQLVDDYG